MALKSVLEQDAPRSPEAEAKLVVLRQQARDFGIASLLGVAGTALAVAAAPHLAFALVAATVLTLVLSGRSLWRRRELLSALLLDRDAYSIEAVRDRATRFATPERRRRLGKWARTIVEVARGEELPASASVRVLPDRVLPRHECLLRIADALEDDDRPVHPASVALLHRLLTRPGLSPLYNPGLDEDLLDLALHRVEAGVDRSPPAEPAIG
jgi:hypothetical protein